MDCQDVDHSSGAGRGQEMDLTQELNAFIDKFTSRYGENAPSFVSASLSEAVHQAFFKGGVDRKPLALYVHRDGPRGESFCRDILTERSVRGALMKDFIVWGWDLTQGTNRDSLLLAVNVYLGPRTYELLQELSMDDFPVLITLLYGRVNVEVHSVITSQECPTVSEVLSVLATTVRKNDEANCPGNNSGTQEEFKLMINDEVHSQSIVLVKFKLPLGNTLEKRFSLNEKFGSVLSFLRQEGYNSTNFKLILLSPRTDMSDVDPGMKLAELRLSPQTQFVLEERKLKS